MNPLTAEDDAMLKTIENAPPSQVEKIINDALNAPLLICTMGLARSGKSTWSRAESQSTGAPMVNPDSIRLALHGQQFYGPAEPWVWAMARTMVESLFIAGHKIVILDATNTTRERRKAWISRKWSTVWRLIETPVDVCLERASGDGPLKEAIRRMAENWEPLGPEDKVVY